MNRKLTYRACVVCTKKILHWHSFVTCDPCKILMKLIGSIHADPMRRIEEPLDNPEARRERVDLYAFRAGMELPLFEMAATCGKGGAA